MGNGFSQGHPETVGQKGGSSKQTELEPSLPVTLNSKVLRGLALSEAPFLKQVLLPEAR